MPKKKTAAKKDTPITPTLGRIVHYFMSQGAEPSAAIIAHVGDNEVLNLCVLDRRGFPRAETSVPLLQPGAERPSEGHYAKWLPYQVKKSFGSESGEKAAGTEEV